MAAKSKPNVLADVREACKELRLRAVPEAAWAGLRDAGAGFLPPELQAASEHLTVEHLKALAVALEPFVADDAAPAASLWQWLAQPAKSSEASSLPRLRALLVVLAQAASRHGDISSAAGQAYFTLLSVRGAEEQRSTIFQPAIFHQALVVLRQLRRGELRHKRERMEEGADGAGSAAEGDDGEQDGLAVPSQEAREVLAKLATFCHHCSLGSSTEVFTTVVEELAALVLRPSEDEVGRAAAGALAGLVAAAGNEQEVRRAAAAVLRATLPALLMTQEHLASLPGGAVPKPLQQARAVALNLVCSIMRSHPALLTVEAPPAPKQANHAEDEEEQPEPAGKRARQCRGGKRRKGADDDEADEEAEGEPEGAEARNPDEPAASAGGEADKKHRRRRPLGHGKDDPIVALLELVCIWTPDRAEWRGFSAESVIQLLSEATAVERDLAAAGGATAAKGRRLGSKTRDLASQSQAAADGSQNDGAILPIAGASAPGTAAGGATGRFAAFLAKLLESERAACRALAAEVAVGLLEKSGKLAQGTPSGAAPSQAEFVSCLLGALVRRCGDAVPSVRSRALGGVSTALQSLAKCGAGTAALLRTAVLDSTHPRHIDLPGLFRAAARDEKPTARRSALALLDAALPLLQTHLGLEPSTLAAFFDTSLLASLSADESLMVRKATISSLSQLLRLCPVPRVCRLWVQSVLPLVLDVEAIVVERALDELELAVVHPIAERQVPTAPPGAARRSLGMSSLGMPPVLRYLDSEATEYLQRGLRRVAKRTEDQFSKEFTRSLCAMIKDCLREVPVRQWPVALWTMLEEVTATAAPGRIDFELVYTAWIDFSKHCADPGPQGAGPLAHLGSKILRVLEQLAPSAPQARTVDLVDSLSAGLSSFSAPVGLVRVMMGTIRSIEASWKAKKLCADKAKARAAWRLAFLRSIQASVDEAVHAEGPPGAHPQAASATARLAASLFSLGELALMDINIISDGVIAKVQTIATNTVYRGGQRVDTDPMVRGHAFATLGKCCLKKESLAKKSVELLVLHLSPSEAFAVRNNVLIALGDLCIHYTSLVDRFVPCLTGLLRDGNELLRKQAAMTLASLLAEDFLKVRSSTLLRFLYALGDPSESVRSFVECVFARILHQRNPVLFPQHFLEVVCAFNGWAGLPGFRGAEGNEDFSLQTAPQRRAAVYRFMLSLMTSDQKFNVCAQIVTTLLTAFVDAEEAVPLPRTVAEPAGQVLSDGLSLLCCKEMRICFTTQRAGQDEEEHEGGAAGGAERAAGADAARGVLSSILKRNMCENIVPVLVQLKGLMESKHSPFLGHLRHCLREILRDFKDDLKVMLSGDPQLAAEIAFDLQKEEGSQSAVGTSIAAGGAAPTPVGLGFGPVLPHRGFAASRRISLGTMMRPQTPSAPPPIADLECTPRAREQRPSLTGRPSLAGRPSLGASRVPQPRRSSLGAAPAPSTPRQAQPKRPSAASAAAALAGRRAPQAEPCGRGGEASGGRAAGAAHQQPEEEPKRYRRGAKRKEVAGEARCAKERRVAAAIDVD